MITGIYVFKKQVNFYKTMKTFRVFFQNLGEMVGAGAGAEILYKPGPKPH
jgi:hypothetical protein